MDIFNTVTFLMAGGRGARLNPLTENRAKPSVPFGGIYKIVDFTLSNCLNSGFHKIHVLVQYNSTSLIRHIKMGWSIFHPQVGSYIDVVPAQQKIGESWYRGTADSIFQNLFVLEEQNPKYCLILSGDHIYKMDYRNLAKFFVNKNADFVMGVVRVPVSKAKGLGICKIDSDDRLVEFMEKPDVPCVIPNDSEHTYASMGVYFTRSDLLKNILSSNTNKDSSARHDFGRDIIPNIYKDMKVYAYDFTKKEKYGSYWKDVGTLNDYYEANMELVNIVPEINLYDREWPIRTHQRQYPPAKTVYDGSWNPGRKGEVTQSLLSQGTIISGGKVTRSILSPNVRLNSFSDIQESVLMEGVNVGRYAKIKRAIIDQNVFIPQYMKIGYNLVEDRKRFYVTDSGIVVVPNPQGLYINNITSHIPQTNYPS